ncbi:amidohydrolase [Moniliophthora roreri MCA 2997]|uniref:Amidohydrolase n=2 Tax=Moniliophthora roreri TaxID=221103 RepID=V2WN54_MONRO|nr:amidohydrolase [Moniliophthora roreri MCA 2997]KAI3615962.1 amidohydrolase [Moniliophthora roreri]
MTEKEAQHRPNLGSPNFPRRRRRVLAALLLASVALTYSNLSTFFPAVQRPPSHFADSENPADSFKDDVWPIRNPARTPWDISTDFPYPRVLQYRVSEGTWLRLDVHPTTGDIVFDMLGDIYCIPGQYIVDSEFVEEQAEARPVLQGIPYDADPHFSPSGDKIVFRSDAGHGLENIWVTGWQGCEAMDLRSTLYNADLAQALQFKSDDDKLFSEGLETKDSKRRRLIREGRAGAKRVTNETFRYITDPRFHPLRDTIVATKWYTSSRSLGAGEGWEYPVPSLDGEGQDPIPVGSGTRIAERTLPAGFTDYNSQQIGPEMIIWHGNDSLIYSKNVIDSTEFEYSKDVHAGIYAIFAKNLTTGSTSTLVSASPGGASRPELSRDGRTLAFVRRVRDKSVLVFKDLETGTITHIWDGLSFDLTAISAPMGTYTSFAFTPNDDAVIIWAAGQIYRVPISTNDRGEKVRAGQPRTIPFTALIELRLADTRTYKTSVDLLNLETQDTSRVYAFKELRVDEEGKRAIFNAATVTVVQDIGKSNISKVPVLDASAPYYFPSFVPGTSGNVLVHARWSDTRFTSFEVADLRSGKAYEVVGLPLGRYRSPVFAASQKKLAFVKLASDYLSGNIVATAGAGLYVADVDVSGLDGASSELNVTNLQFIPSDVDPSDRIQLRFTEDTKLLVSQSRSSSIIDLAGETDITGRPPSSVIATGRTSTELVSTVKPASSGWRQWASCMKKMVMNQDSGYVAENVAFVDFLYAYVAPGSSVQTGDDAEGVWSKPGNSTKGLARVGLDGGHDLTFSEDGKKLFWFLGPFLHSLELSKLSQCSSEIEQDPETFGISCVKNLVEFQEVFVEHSTDIARLKKDVKSTSRLIIQNATLLTLETGNLDTDLIHGGSLVIKDGVFESVGSLNDADLENAEVIQANGGFIIPGFLDVHAHWNGASNPTPAKSWEMETFLAYGVTAMHNPSTDTVDTFIERSRVESGYFVGPRILHTGSVIYGAAEPSLHQLAVDMDDAMSTLIRIKAEGGPYGISYKNYNQPLRSSRQRLLLAAKNLSMLCVPEGGMNYDWDLTYIIDGMTTVEHAIPVPALYDDVRQLFAQSGTQNTPTHVVNYGGTFGEQYVWANHDVPNDPKLRQFTRHDQLEEVTESTARPRLSYQLFNTSESLAKMVGLGLKTMIGAHGEPPLGLNYHYEVFFTQQGGLSNYQTLQAASSWPAETFGLFTSLGSLSQGKLADFLVYPAGIDLLEGPIEQTRALQYVARGGRIWDASTMEEVWPVKGRKQEMPPINPE